MEVASSPHVNFEGYSTRSMMWDVIIALAPAVFVAVWYFGWSAVEQIGLCVLSCMVFEAFFSFLRGRKPTLDDGSAILTGLILGLSLPWSAPWQAPVFGSLIAIGVGKMAYGGLGQNIFNPAMVGRAFIMISFASAMGSGAYVVTQHENSILTRPTPMTMLKDTSDSGIAKFIDSESFLRALRGERNGSLGEASVFALVFGGCFLLMRKTISWRIPISMLATIFVLGALVSPLEHPMEYGLAHLLNGAALLGAFFIATDPVTSPITPRGKIYFGIGVGALTMLFRLFSGYPEGVMFAVLLMNAVVPFLNNMTIPKPFGAENPSGST